MKPNFVRKKKRKQHGATFWDSEYANPTHLKLSAEPSEDLVKFTRWLQRQPAEIPADKANAVVDVGCGNGRNLIFLAREFNMSGTGFDISSAAISQAVRASKGLPLVYQNRTVAGTINLPDNSHALALDMMTSHFLKADERRLLRDELYRILAPGGFLFMKTFLKDGDLHTSRLLEQSPGPESDSYIHPVIGVPEYVYSEEALVNFLEERFIIKKIYRSHKHAWRGQAGKRRTITIYAQKDPYAKN